ncbi:MAG: MscL family protein [Candidatus Saccharibacteria bacterium]|nr:MscL family protein [Candidatus Saccharibacteria bacterium]
MAKAVEVVKNSPLGGFMDFIRTQGVVGLAVGLAIGTAAGDTVKKLVAAFIDPLVQLIIGSQEGLQAASFTVEIAGRKGEFLYGAFISSLITLLAVAFVVYAIIHFLKLDKLDKKKD